uniref:Ig-like domain-containing protein n=1 Tax=Nothoprocta perdicaria TaxID=30464 RepID=A0A8C6YZD2_NOTPE
MGTPWLLPALLLPGCWALTGPTSVHGFVGGTLSVSCKYEDGLETNEKFWCKPGNIYACAGPYIIATSERNSFVRKDRISIWDDRRQREFTVTMSNLTEVDTGTYLCGVWRPIPNTKPEWGFPHPTCPFLFHFFSQSSQEEEGAACGTASALSPEQQDLYCNVQRAPRPAEPLYSTVLKPRPPEAPGDRQSGWKSDTVPPAGSLGAASRMEAEAAREARSPARETSALCIWAPHTQRHSGAGGGKGKNNPKSCIWAKAESRRAACLAAVPLLPCGLGQPATSKRDSPNPGKPWASPCSIS